MKNFLIKFKLAEWIGVLGLSIMGTVTFANILARYVFKASWAFTEEIVTSLFLLISLLGASIGARRGSLIGLNMLTDLLPKKYQKYVNVLQSAFVCIFALILCYYGVGMAKSEWDMGIKTSSLGIPEAVYGAFIPIGAFFLIINSISNIVMNLKKTSDEEDRGEEV